MGTLTHDELHELRAAIISARLGDSREALLAGIDPAFRAVMRFAHTSGEQVLCDLDMLNDAGALADGNIPLITWLRNAAALTAFPSEARVFEDALEQLTSRTAAFLLGWYSMYALLPTSDLSAVLPNIDKILTFLSITTPAPTSSYFGDSRLDGGSRAQDFRILVSQSLFARKNGASAARHFTTIGNAVLHAVECQHGVMPNSVRKKLQMDAGFLNLPGSLSVVPDTDALDWLNRVVAYFELLAFRLGGAVDEARVQVLTQPPLR